MRRSLLIPAFFLTTSCAASIPRVEHDAAMQEQQRAYEDRLRRADDEKKRAEKTCADEKTEAEHAQKSSDARVEQLESALADKQRTLDDVTNQLVELQDAFSKVSSKERTQIEARIAKEKTRAAAIGELEKRLQDALADEIKDAKVELSSREDSVLVRFKDGVLFQRGGVKLEKTSKNAIDRLAAAIKASPESAVRIEAHTDSVRSKEGAKEDADTWSLTQAQGLAIVHALGKLGVDPSRLSYVSYGQFRPLASNDTAEGRASNRRIELVLSAPRAR